MFLRGRIWAAVLCLIFSAISTLCAQVSIERKAFASLKKIFGDSVAVTARSLHISPEEKKAIAERSRTPWIGPDSITLYTCRTGAGTAGYGVVDNVKGKDRPITYLAAITPAGEVADIDVLVYRESHGGEIAYESFRKQFRKKTTRDELQPGKDIKNISGATISVRAITFGTRRLLAAFHVLHSRIDTQ